MLSFQEGRQFFSSGAVWGAFDSLLFIAARRILDHFQQEGRKAQGC
jgi:hypothetical protein